MSDFVPTILSQLELSAQQATAALSEAPAIAVTAGAGSGKTRTLVGRYLWLVEQGYPVRTLVAITFTEKAAREMRNRIREEIGQWRTQALAAEQRALWDRAATELDAARIGTIHGLCAGILRAHPAEAAVDPMFEVLEENTAILLQARAVEEALAWAIDDAVCASLFGPLNEQRLRETISTLLQRRLDARPAFRAIGDDVLQHWSDAVAARFYAQLAGPDWRQALDDLAGVSARRPDDKLELARQDVLAAWSDVQSAQAAEGWDDVIAGLMAMRQSIKTNVGAKGNWNGDELTIAKGAMRTLRQQYDDGIKPLLGSGRSASPPSWALDRQVAQLLPGLQRLFAKTLAIYEGMKAERQALDFDDLESMATALLVEHPAVRARWQSDIAAVLVDEFQDTNARQREIVYQITGFRKERVLGIGDSVLSTTVLIPNSQYPISTTQSPIPNLFIVGDGKQSIYRFRGADVSVFRQVQEDIGHTGGQLVDLDTTYRAHRPLVYTLNALLAPILGEEEDPDRPYHTPFAPLHAHRPAPKPPIEPPFLEFHLGLGNAEEGRANAAAALAARLHELHQQGSEWGHMALLFRASTAFGVYEDALAAVGIPFVTVAGRGFYQRPEVRDLLNALAAIADPTDDLALAGLLRSPMFGLSDGALFTLRWGNEPGRGRMGFWQALAADDTLTALAAVDAAQAGRAQKIVRALHQQAGRTSVASVLKKLLDLTYYRAALQQVEGGDRAWRNVEKLLADAHRSRLVGVDDFLDYVHSLRDVAAREGEAATEAGNAVQLMTVHKAKGLEFPIVVIADAGYGGRSRSEALLLDAELGPLLKISEGAGSKSVPLMYKLAQQRLSEMEEAESRRLLYVAATRAEDLLLISGQGKFSTRKQDPGRLLLGGWLQWLGEVVGISGLRYPDPPTTIISEILPWQMESAGLWLYPSVAGDREGAPPPTSDLRPLTSDLRPLTLDLLPPLPQYESPDKNDEKTEEKDTDPPRRVWRVTPKTRRARAPSWVVGILVHRALQYWRFPDDPDFAAFLRPYALERGLSSEQEIRDAIARASELLLRFQTTALFAELDLAERHHELPYAVKHNDEQDAGIVDLIARRQPDAPWNLYDFKTDRLAADIDLEAHIADKKYDEQIRRYITALHALLGQRPEAFLVFLDVGREVVISCRCASGQPRQT